MKTDLIHNMIDTFEAHAQETENGVEFWLARDLQHLLGYSEWRNFTEKRPARCQTTPSQTILLTSTKWSIWVRVVRAGRITERDKGSWKKEN